jgi:hypothetical protein
VQEEGGQPEVSVRRDFGKAHHRWIDLAGPLRSGGTAGRGYDPGVKEMLQSRDWLPRSPPKRRETRRPHCPDRHREPAG